MSECTHTPWITLLLILLDASLFYFSILQPFLPNGKNGAGGPNARAHAATSWKWESADAPVNLLLPAMETQLRRLHVYQSPPIQVAFWKLLIVSWTSWAYIEHFLFLLFVCSCWCLGRVGCLVRVRPLLLQWQEVQISKLQQCSLGWCLWWRSNWDGSMLIRLLIESKK